MKNLYILFIGIFFLSTHLVQAQNDSMKHEIGFHLLSVEYTGISPLYFSIEPFSGMHYKHQLKNRYFLRGGIFFYEYDIENLPEGGDWYEARAVKDMAVSVGFEKQFGKNKFKTSIGSDLIYAYQRSIGTSGGGITGQYVSYENYQKTINAAVFVDLNYFICPLFSISIESSVEMGFGITHNLLDLTEDDSWEFDETPDLHLLNNLSLNVHF